MSIKRLVVLHFLSSLIMETTFELLVNHTFSLTGNELPIYYFLLSFFGLCRILRMTATGDTPSQKNGLEMERDGRLVDAGKVKIIRPIPISECEEWKRMDKEKERKPFKCIKRKGEGIHNRSEIAKKINISHIPCVTHARCLTSCQKHGPKNIFHHVLLPFFSLKHSLPLSFSLLPTRR